MPKNRQHHRKAKYPDKVAKPKSLVFVRIFLFRSAGSKITYFPTAPFFLIHAYAYSASSFTWLDKHRYLIVSKPLESIGLT